MTDNTALATLKADIDDIYLGNLGTVEADLELPATGKRGSAFAWVSGERLFLADDGRVTRPTFGVGDRDVPLTLTATFEGERMERIYTVTVLQEQPQTTIVAVDDVEVTAFAGGEVSLPSVAVVRLSDGSAEVRPVSWGEASLADVGADAGAGAAQAGGEPADYAEGRIEGWDGPVRARVRWVFAHPAAAARNAAQASASGFVRSSARLTGNGALAAKVRSRVEFLRGVDDDRMLFNFRAAAGLDTRGAEPMTGWDNPEGNLRGHTTGHYLSALALASAVTGDETLRAKMDRMVTALGECQRALHENKGYSWGFLSGYSEEQFDKLEEFVTYPTIWAPYYTFDKIVSGLLDCYEYAGSREALDIALRMGFWANARLGRLSKAQRDKMWSIYIAGEYGAIISALVRLHRITGNATFARTAGYFHNDKLLYPMEAGVDTLGGMHANQHIPQIIGALDTALWCGDMEGLSIARNFWTMVTDHHLYAIGGVGETEMFRAPDAIAGYLTDKPAESCATHNLSKLSMKLFEAAPDASYADYYEHALFNDLLPATHGEPDGGTVYFFPLRPGGKLSFDTDENTCCHGTGLENMFRFEEQIVKGTHDKAYVNLYLPCEAEACAGALALTIGGDLDEGYVIDVRRNADAEVLLRRPQWATGMEVTLNGAPAAMHEAAEPGYVAFDAKLRAGDRIGVKLGAALRTIAAPDDPAVAALAWGPYVLAVLSEAQEFIEIPRGALEQAGRQACTLSDALRLVGELAGAQCVRLADLDDQRYHVYLRLTD